MPSSSPPPDDLTSWKAISDYLGVNIRTAQKWERNRRLPVRRSPGEKGRVSALSSELDAWKVQQSGRSWRLWASPAFLRLYAAAATLAVVALASAFLWRGLRSRSLGRPTSFRVAYRTLSVLDEAGRTVWQHSFEEPLAADAYTGIAGQQRLWFGDLDGDKGIETLFIRVPAESVTKGTALICFSQTGSRKWSFRPPAVADGRRLYSPAYLMSSFAVVDLGDGRGAGVAVTSRHTGYHPNNFAILDARGARRADYWHSGHLDYMDFADLDGDGIKEVLLSGVRNSARAATLVVLDPRTATGATRESAGSEYQIRGFAEAREKAIMLFPRSCVSRLFDLYNMGKLIQVDRGRITLWVAERLSDESQVSIHTLDFSLRPVAIQVSDAFRAAHRMLEVEGKLDHRLSEGEIEDLNTVSFLRR